MQVACSGVPAASSLSPPAPWRSSRALPPRAPPPASPRRRAAPQGLGGLMHLRLCLRDSLRALAVVSALPSASRASTPRTLAARPSPKAPTCRPDLLRSISPAPSPLRLRCCCRLDPISRRKKRTKWSRFFSFIPARARRESSWRASKTGASKCSPSEGPRDGYLHTHRSQPMFSLLIY